MTLIKFYYILMFLFRVYLSSLKAFYFLHFLHIPPPFKFCILSRILSSLLYTPNLFLYARTFYVITRLLFTIKTYPHIIVEIINPITPYLRTVIIDTLKRECTRTDSDDSPARHGGRACK